MTWHARAWTAADLDGAALAIADVAAEDEARAFRDAAEAAGVPVNVVDKPAFCDFQFGALVERSPLIVAISTDGGAPVFGQRIRALIETLLPQGFRDWAAAAKAWRPQVDALRLDFRARRDFWERFTALAVSAADRMPDDADRAALLAMREPTANRTGRVALIDAGPGPAGFLTRDGGRWLHAADVVLYEPPLAALVSDAARREAEKIPLDGAELVAQAIAMAREGKTVAVALGTFSVRGGARQDAAAQLDAAGMDAVLIAGVSAPI